MAATTKNNILVITYWDFNEAHIQANVLPNLKILSSIAAGSEIYLFCLNKKPISQSQEQLIKKELAPHRIHLLWFHYSHFGIKIILKFGWLIPYLCFTVFSKNIRQIYAWCTTAGGIGYILSIFSGAELILESYEPHAESMIENEYWTKYQFPYKILSYFEKKQAQRARWVIAANKGMIDYVKGRYQFQIDPAIFFAKPACINFSQFYPDIQKKNQIRNKLGYNNNNVVCVYAGKFGGIYLEKEIFDLLKAGYDYWGDRFRILLLTSQSIDYIKENCFKTGLPFQIINVIFLPHHQIPLYMQAGDFGICPVKPVPTKKYCTPVKNGEYWALGLPVIITENISDDSDIIRNNEIGAVLEGLTYESYIKAIRRIDFLLKGDMQKLQLSIVDIAKKYRDYKIAFNIYKAIYN